MDLKHFVAVVFATACATFGLHAAMTYPVNLQQPPETSKVTQTYDETTGIYTIHVDENNFGDDASRPAVRLEALTEKLPEYARTLAFDYKTTVPCGQQKFVCYKLITGTMKQSLTLTESMEVSEQWQTYRISLATMRTSTRKYGEIIGQYQDLLFLDLVAGADLQIRNIHYEEEEVPFTDVTLSPTTDAIIEAENFNISPLEGKNYHSNQVNFVQKPYISPTPGQFPIYGFTSIDYNQQNVSDDFMTNMKATADLMNKKYRDMEAAGFNITEGGTYPAIDRCFLYDGDDGFNGYQANLHDGVTNLRMMIRGGVHEENVIREAMGSDRCAGYVIIDEPHMTGFNGCNVPAAASKANSVWEIDNTRLLYGNLLHINTIPGDFGAKSYDDYVKTFIEKTGIGVISYDYYAVRIIGDDAYNVDAPATPENCILMPNFFMNMEVVSKHAKHYGIPWWGFTMAQGGATRTGASSVYPPSTFRYPAPREEAMRVQIFSLLCYGAQGIQYWPYAAHGATPNGPCNSDGTLNPSYYYAKAINTEVKALTWVFLGAEMLHVGHTNAVTPDGCLRLTKALMPEGVTAVTTSGNGMPVSTLQNGSNVFMMAVNPDLWNNQDITVTIDKSMKRVLTDGTTEDVAAGDHKYTLTPGGYLIYLVDDKAAELDKHRSPAPVFDTYRNDADNVAVTASTKSSNGFYLPDMGTHAWNVYVADTPLEETRTISRALAQQHWGATFAYTFDVAEDMIADIYIGHSVPWSEYGRVASTGARPGISYTIEGDPTLNWPKQYAASMLLTIDGDTIASAQDMRPAVPETFEESGAEFDAILADKSKWISTEGDPTLYFWPKAGGDNDVTPRYNQDPDYAGVRLAAGTHRIEVKSNCYPWNFDNIRITASDLSGIAMLGDGAAASLKAWGGTGEITVEAGDHFDIFNLAGLKIGSGYGNASVEAAAGIYLVTSGNSTVKVIVK